MWLVCAQTSHIPYAAQESRLRSAPTVPHPSKQQASGGAKAVGGATLWAYLRTPTPLGLGYDSGADGMQIPTRRLALKGAGC